MEKATTNRLLIIDDEPDIRASLGTMFTWKGWNVALAKDAPSAMSVLSGGFEGAVLVDIRLPGCSGLDFIAELPEPIRERTEYAIMTGHGGLCEAVTALRLGVRDFLRKPFSLDEAVHTVETCLGRLRDRQTARREAHLLRRRLECENGNLRHLLERVDASRVETVDALVATIEHRASETAAHLRRMARYVDTVAAILGYGESDRRELALASRLHDIGKIGIPDGILTKPGPLFDIERQAVETHTLMGQAILSRVENPIMVRARRAALHHHERWNGSGYPDGLIGERIPFEARLVAVVDVYDTLRSERSYKPAMDHETAIRVLRNGDDRAGPEDFDPELIALLPEVASKFAAIYASDPDQGRAWAAIA